MDNTQQPRKSLLANILSTLAKRPGLILLTILLTIITLTNIKPDFYLVGWDNYSSYFNLKTNLFRTFFATWREYRGLGVPSDAEVTDIFRQLFFLVFHFVTPGELLDQLYYLFSLWLGTLSMYATARLLLKHFSFQNNHSRLLKTDLFPTLASFFYLFNLSTLSVFYSPIIPFTNRFYALPLTLYVILRYTTKKTVKNFLLAALTIVVTAGSYITPTVVITSSLAFFTFLATHL
ncbi:MAG: hypothetical protein HYS86_04360, partial [Candidatus Chisholmbacteria bacterium]|nr:hypothetical protein [Candidatus Chisholmbacteria bacterium]